MTKKKHFHLYERKALGDRGYKVFKCAIPGCTHYIGVEMSEGRIYECSRCHRPTVMTKAAMRLAKPHCTDCTAQTDNAKKIEDRLKSLGL